MRIGGATERRSDLLLVGVLLWGLLGRKLDIMSSLQVVEPARPSKRQLLSWSEAVVEC